MGKAIERLEDGKWLPLPFPYHQVVHPMVKQLSLLLRNLRWRFILLLSFTHFASFIPLIHAAIHKEGATS